MPESKLGGWDRWLSAVYLPSCQDLKLWVTVHRDYNHS